MQTSAEQVFKHAPPTWVSEYGFDAAKGERLPSAVYQAALISRAFILNCASGIPRTFWRHTPDAQYDLPFTKADGSAMPSLLAMRTTLQMLDGVVQYTDVTSPLNGNSLEVHAYLLHVGDVKVDKKKGTKAKKGHYLLALWSNALQSDNASTGLAFKSSASRVTVTDLWGNTTEMQPIDGVAMCQVDEFPRFIDLGESDQVELYPPFASMDPPRLVLHDNGVNRFALTLYNNERLFHGQLSLDLHFRRWPVMENDTVRTEKITLNILDHDTLYTTLSIPANLSKTRKGEIYEVNLEIFLGNRRFGILTLPVGYTPQVENTEKK